MPRPISPSGRPESRPIEQRYGIPVERGGNESRKPGAAEQAPERQALPAAGRRGRPDAERRSGEGAQQEKIERDAGDESCRENKLGDIDGHHGAWRKNQSRFANLRQDAERSVSTDA